MGFFRIWDLCSATTHTCIIFCTFFCINLAHCITVASSILFSMQPQQPPYSYSIDCIQRPHRVPFHVLFLEENILFRWGFFLVMRYLMAFNITFSQMVQI